MSADLLETIVAATRRIVEVREAGEPKADLARRAEARHPRPGRFHDAIASPDRINIIAECKRRSPSRGVLRVRYDAADIAAGYADAGAAAISVLTEPTFFDGSLTDLVRVRAVVDIPVLRKDFIISEYQLFEARAAGADAVLLIVAALSRTALAALHRTAGSLGLDVLVEVHSTTELAVALDAGARIVGVNNRNLRTLEVDVRGSQAIAAAIPTNVVAVSESGLRTADDLHRLGRLGYRAFLIGERFMAEPSSGQALGDLIQHAREDLRHHAR